MPHHLRVMAAAIALIALAAASGARADDDRISISNQTGERIVRMFISPSSSDRWTRVNMDDDLLNGNVMRIRLPERWRDHCHYDLMVHYPEGGHPRWLDLDFCRIHRITLTWDRRLEKTRAVSD